MSTFNDNEIYKGQFTLVERPFSLATYKTGLQAQPHGNKKMTIYLKSKKKPNQTFYLNVDHTRGTFPLLTFSHLTSWPKPSLMEQETTIPQIIVTQVTTSNAGIRKTCQSTWSCKKQTSLLQMYEQVQIASGVTRSGDRDHAGKLPASGNFQGLWGNFRE